MVRDVFFSDGREQGSGSREGSGDRRRRVRRQHPRAAAAGARLRRRGRGRADRLLRPATSSGRTCSASASPAAAWCEADLNALDLDALLADVEVVYHQAGQPGVRRRGAPTSTATRRTTSCATQRLLEAALRAPRPRRGSSTPRPRRSTATPCGTRPRRPTGRSRSARTASPSWPPSTCAALYARELRPADGLAALLHRLRPPAAAGHGASPASAAPCGTSAEIAGVRHRRPGPRLHVRRRRRRGEPPRGGDKVDKGAVFNVAGGTSTTVNEVLELLGRDLRPAAAASTGATGPRGRPADRREHRGHRGGHRLGTPPSRCGRGSRSSTGGSPPS